MGRSTDSPSIRHIGTTLGTTLILAGLTFTLMMALSTRWAASSLTKKLNTKHNLLSKYTEKSDATREIYERLLREQQKADEQAKHIGSKWVITLLSVMLGLSVALMSIYTENELVGAVACFAVGGLCQYVSGQHIGPVIIYVIGLATFASVYLRSTGIPFGRFNIPIIAIMEPDEPESDWDGLEPLNAPSEAKVADYEVRVGAKARLHRRMHKRIEDMKIQAAAAEAAKERAEDEADAAIDRLVDLTGEY